LHPHRRVQAEPVDVGTQRLAHPVLAWRRSAQGQHLLPGAGAEGDAVGDGRGLQRPQRARLLAVGIRLGQIADVRGRQARSIMTTLIAISDYDPVRGAWIPGGFKSKAQHPVQ